MNFYSTKNKNYIVDLEKAVMQSLPPDNGLYMPVEIPKLPKSFFDEIEKYSIADIAKEVSRALIKDAIPEKDLNRIVEMAINFPAPLVEVEKDIYSLELFHGPSLAFKDFGARYMAQLMGYFNRNEDRKLTILVATSGDTGGAVAAGFYKTPGIEVIILYPSGKVSDLQEKQLTTLGENITALEINGTFDDCQALVKKAFLDEDLNLKYRLSSANSINIARLIPQSFYYMEAWKQLKDKSKKVVVSVPSGNFGNLTAGLLAKRMGLPIDKFIAATNVNRVVPDYLQTGKYESRPSIPTLSNAMDVGSPSNFVRMLDLYGADWDEIKHDIVGFSCTDEETATTLRELFERTGYLADPHGAVAYKALTEFVNQYNTYQGIFFETAHPAKFLPDVEAILQTTINVPERLARLKNEPKVSISMNTDFEGFKEWLLGRS